MKSIVPCPIAPVPLFSLLRWSAALVFTSLCFGTVSPSPNHSHSIAVVLSRHWTEEYSLHEARVPGDDAKWPAVGAGSNVSVKRGPYGVWPRPPHLEDCAKQSASFVEKESRGTDGQDPAWANVSNPRPFWVRGSEEDNLAGTRQAQVDLWRRQFPSDSTCQSSRLLVVTWPIYLYGIGSSLHMMGKTMFLAFISNRVFVPLNGSYFRSEHEGCLRFGKWGALECYWAPTTLQSCVLRAAKELQRRPQKGEGQGQDDYFKFLTNIAGDPSEEDVLKAVESLSSGEDIVFLNDPVVLRKLWFPLRKPWNIPQPGRAWGTPWVDRPFGEEAAFTGRLTHLEEKSGWPKWWLAQTTRFLLRWPSRYLCHLSNRARHDAFGLQVAVDILRSVNPNGTFPEVAEGDSLDDTVWANQEPYMPRPMLHMQIRQGDKASETSVFSAQDYLSAVYRFRLHNPQLENIWLSTEMEPVIHELTKHTDWKWYYTRGISRQETLDMASWDLDVKIGYEAQVGDLFVNLLIGSQCDFFLGLQSSNYFRLMDELRKTNGRFRAGVVVMSGDAE